MRLHDFIVQTVAAPWPDECVLWPYGCDTPGYGILSHDGKRLGAHREACRLAHGEPPPGAMALHSCDVRPCINPRHLRWGTPTDNHDDRRARGAPLPGNPGGARNSNARLTDEDVAAIRASPDNNVVLGSRYGVSRHHISKIRNGHRWPRAR